MGVSRHIFEDPNAGKRIHEIVDKTACPFHGATKGTPCYKIHYDVAIEGPNGRQTYGFGICNSRVISAGYNGKITAASLAKTGRGSR